MIYRTIPIPYFIGNHRSKNKYIDDYNFNKNYISITFTNGLMPRVRTPKNPSRKYKLINIKNQKGKNSTDSGAKRTKKQNIQINAPDYFSLDEFLIPHTGMNGEKLFYTKKEKY